MKMKLVCEIRLFAAEMFKITRGLIHKEYRRYQNSMNSNMGRDPKSSSEAYDK